MAVSGSSTTAYVVEVKPTQTTTLRELCATPADTVAAVRRGERATVQGSDMPEFWRLLKSAEPEIVGLLRERVNLLERMIFALHAVLCPESALLQGENIPSITAVVAELQGKYFER
jgi:hypothetical protein